MAAILFVLRTGCPWSALNATRLCHKSTAYSHYREWLAAGLFARLWELALEHYDPLQAIHWEWLALDGALTKAPLGGEATGPNPTDRGKSGTQRSLLTDDETEISNKKIRPLKVIPGSPHSRSASSRGSYRTRSSTTSSSRFRTSSR